MKKDKKLIPKGDYCHHSKDIHKLCPYWSMREDLPEQQNGYCYYMKKSDYDLNREMDDKDVKIIFKGKTEIKKGKDVGINFSMIWDQVKECGEKLNEERN